jgi:outer membrane protein assembly factor BamB
MNRKIAYIALTIIGLAAITVATAENNWPQWRGPSQNGVSDAQNLPTTWSGTENIVWKTPLPAWSGSTPVIWGDRVFVISPSKSEAKPQTAPEVEDGEGSQRQRRRAREGLEQNDSQRERSRESRQRRRGRRRGRRGGGRDPGGDELLLLCLSKTDGKILWERELDTGNKLHRKDNNTSPSPVTDGTHVWTITGTGMVKAFDMQGVEIWKKSLQDDYGAFGLNFGYASSPLLHDGKLILEVLHGQRTDDPSYVVALDAMTGKELWHHERETDAIAESPDAYTTPTLAESNGKTQIIITGGDYVTGHDSETGQEIWRAAGLNPERRRNYRIVGSPLVVDGMVYAPTRQKPLLALRTGGTSDVTESHLVWKWEDDGAPDVPTPVCDGKYFYMVNDRGLVTCLDAKTGELIWGPERTAQGVVSSSPILADQKLYILNENGVTTVIAAGSEFKILATNELDGSYTLSSPAVAGKHLFIRTGTHLYCIGAR